jgi:hypothetical protein
VLRYTWLSHDTGPLLCHDQGQLVVRASAVLLSTACAGPPAVAAYCDVRQIIEVGVAVHLALAASFLQSLRLARLHSVVTEP